MLCVNFIQPIFVAVVNGAIFLTLSVLWMHDMNAQGFYIRNEYSPYGRHTYKFSMGGISNGLAY